MKVTAGIALALALGGCATPAPRPPAAPATAEERTAAAEALSVERQWLVSWFHGTPTRIEQHSDGAVTVEVPREFCFEPGKTGVRPALAAVLSKVAESLRRVSAATVPLIAAPGDPGGATALALQRADAVHDYLRAHGVAAARLGKPAAAGAAAAVKLRIEPGGAGI